MRNRELDTREKAVVSDQVRRMLAQSESFRTLSAAQRADIERNTVAVASAIATQALTKGRPGRRPLGGALAADKKPLDAQAAEASVRATGNMMREVNFPNFVAELVNGTFQAIVKSSMEQMKAYGELVRSVAMSLNDFRDANVDEQQGHENLVQRYPQVFQMNVVEGASRATVKDDFDSGSLPNFQSDLGLDEEITDLDDETVATKLVPAARDSIARNRQKLLATMVLMGINRIVVTNGKINAKVRFDFTAHDSMTSTEAGREFENLGESTTRRGIATSGGIDLYSQETAPIIKVSSTSSSETVGTTDTTGFVYGEVSLNFKSETFPLEKMVDSGQMMRLDSAQRGGTATAPTPPPPAPVAPASPSPAPAPTP